MDWKKLWQRWIGASDKEKKKKDEKKEDKKDWFRILFPIILLGAVIFLVLPNTNIAKEEKGTQISGTGTETSDSELLHQRRQLTSELEEAFSHMSGVGKTKVVILYADGGEASVLQDEKSSRSLTEEKDSAGGSRRVEEEDRDRTTVSDASGQPYVLKETAPAIQGVLILAEGASSAVVREQLMRAAQALKGVPDTNIQVASYQD